MNPPDGPAYKAPADSESPIQDSAKDSPSKFAIFGAATSLTTLLVNVIRSKVAAEVIGPSGVGIVAEVVQLLTLFTSAAAVAFGPVLVTWTARAHAKGDRDALSLGLGTALTLGAILIVTGTAGAIAVAPWIFPETWNVNIRLLVWMAGWGLSFTAAAGAFHGLFTGMSDLKALTAFALTSAVLGALPAVFLTPWLGLSGQFISIAVGGTLTFTAGWLIALKSRARPIRLKLAWSKEYVRESMKVGGVALLAAVFTQVVYSTIRLILEMHGDGNSGAYYNGNYQAAFLIANQYFTVVVTGLTTFFWPRLARADNSVELEAELDSAARFVLKVAPPAVFAVIALRDLVIHSLYSSRFDLAITILGLQLPGDIVRAVAVVYSGALLYRGHTKGFLVTELTGGAVAVASTWTFVHFFGPMGSGIAYTISQFVYLPLVMLVVRACWNVKFAGAQMASAMSLGALAIGFERASTTWPVVRLAALPLIALWCWRSGLGKHLRRRADRLQALLASRRRGHQRRDQA